MMNLFSACIKKYSGVFYILVLAAVCFFAFFFNTGSYPLMDTDETRYVSMARDMFNSKDFLTLYLNGEYFFEKPPLFFWGECLSFALWGGINEFSARFPCAVYASILVFLVYFAGLKIVSRRFGFLSAVILACSAEFFILGKFAVLDILLACLIGVSVISGFLTQFVQEKNVKYFWYLFYLFSGLAVLAKGVPGFVIPFGAMFFISLYNKSLKKIFKPQYIIPGILIFAAVIIPWHAVMFDMHNPLFFNEYIMKHHIDRFFSSQIVHRKAPFYFYPLTLLWGLFPFILPVIAAGVSKLKEKIILRSKQKTVIETASDYSIKKQNTPEKQFLVFNIIAACFIILFFSSSSTKLITYILPVYPFAAVLSAYIWEDYLYNNKYEKPFKITACILGVITALAAAAALFMPLYLPDNIYSYIKPAQNSGAAVCAFFAAGSIYAVLKNYKKMLFAVFAIFMLIISAFGVKTAFNIDFAFGQDDLMKYADYCRENNFQPAVINAGRKYSVLYYYGSPVKYLDFAQNTGNLKIEEALKDRNTLFIVKNKDFEAFASEYNAEIVSEGVKYKLLKVF